MKLLPLLFAVLLVPSAALAQFSGLQTTVSLSAFPQFPAPHQEVRVSLNAASIDTTGAAIRWSVDGVEQTAARNQRELVITAGALGTAQRITATINKGGMPTTAALTLAPSIIRLYFEADTLVPPFYQGRPLPSSGSTLRAIAVPELGYDAAPESLSYQWRLGSTVLRGGSVRGLNTLTFTVPAGSNQVLYVDVFDSTGALVGQAASELPRVAPQITFYANNPLRGLSQLAIPDDYLLLEDEITIRAVPYFMSRDILDGNSLVEWEVGNQKIDNPSDDPQELTLHRQGETGRFSIGFHIRNLQDLLQGARESFSLRF